MVLHFEYAQLSLMLHLTQGFNLLCCVGRYVICTLYNISWPTSIAFKLLMHSISLVLLKCSELVSADYLMAPTFANALTLAKPNPQLTLSLAVISFLLLLCVPAACDCGIDPIIFR